ncbi:MAG: multiple antibiotic resistance protein [Methanolobus sp.]|jgi:multiple antibiotic resistance protein|nr:multiple antibiotic resistance protein [Methanolobus sp.]MDK2833175.1 multiple antibiotic resistance protein [Methanolobus sp.]MDN5310246.1 multiple antibiotic resistance protein [Methanolobus sp.]
MQDMAFFLGSFLSLFAIVSPLSGVVTFVSLTNNITFQDKNTLANKSVALACIIALFFAFTGGLILDFFGITVDALRIAGGALLFVVAFDMILGKVSRESITESEIDSSIDRSDIWIFPIALPLLTGPGTISTVIVLMSTADSIIQSAGVIVAILLTFLISLILFRFSRRIYKFMGYTGMLVFTRLMGLLLAALAVNFVATGVWNTYMAFSSLN